MTVGGSRDILKLLILVLCIFVSATLESEVNSSTTTATTTKPGSANGNSTAGVEPVIIVISFDGFRYDYLKRVETTHLNELQRSGVKVPYMRNQFVTKTFTNHQSIATGLHAESHGIMDNSFYDPKFNQTLHVGDNETYWKFSDSVLPIWTLNEMAGGRRRSGCMMWPGSDEGYGVNNIRPTYYVRWNDSIPWKWRVDKVMEWLVDDTNPANLIFLYFEEPDEIAHGYGPESPQVTQQILHVDNITGYLVSQLKSRHLYDTTNLILLSDHGFQEVRQDHIINISSVVPTEMYQRYGNTPVIQLQPKEGQFTFVYQSFKDFAARNKHFAVYSKEELPDFWNYKHNRRVAGIVLVPELGYAFDDFYSSVDYYNKKFNFTANPSRVYGVHGYDNREKQMHPFFVARGPVFKSGVEVEPFDNVDIFPLLCLLLGIHATPHNGTLKHVKTLLNINHSSMGFGFGFQSPVGWAMAAAILVGLTILFGILSLMIVKRNQTPGYPSTENGYRYVNDGELIQVQDRRSTHHSNHNSMSSDRASGLTFTSSAMTAMDMKRANNIFDTNDSDEIQALLLSSSNEEL